jgi:cytochrome c oxidase subunit 4
MSHQENSSHYHDGPHIVPMWVYWAVFISLLIGTIATVVAATLDLGPINIPFMLAIAIFKGSLVALFFMHLFWDDKLHLILFISGIGFIAIFFIFTLMDPMTRGALDRDVERELISEQYRINIFDLSEEELDPLRPFTGHHGGDDHGREVHGDSSEADAGHGEESAHDDAGTADHAGHDHDAPGYSDGNDH